MEGKGSWRLAFEMVELDRMARPTHNGAQGGHQLPLEDGACAPPFWTGVNVFLIPMQSGSIRLPPCTHAQPACAWHAAAASCMHGGAAPHGGYTNTAV